MVDETYIKILKEVKQRLPTLLNDFSLIELYYFWECYSNKLDAQFLVASILDDEGCKEEFISCVKEQLEKFNDCRIVEVGE